MRILSYKNEKQIVCPHCGTKLAYGDDDIYKENDYLDRNHCVDSVKNFMRWAKKNKDIFKQLKPKQISTLEEHLDWVCDHNVINRKIYCLHCDHDIELTPVLKYIDIYPENSEIAGNGEIVGKSYFWESFNEL